MLYRQKEFLRVFCELGILRFQKLILCGFDCNRKKSNPSIVTPFLSFVSAIEFMNFGLRKPYSEIIGELNSHKGQQRPTVSAVSSGIPGS